MMGVLKDDDIDLVGLKTTGDLDLLMAEFAEVSGRGKENVNLDRYPRLPVKQFQRRLLWRKTTTTATRWSRRYSRRRRFRSWSCPERHILEPFLKIIKLDHQDAIARLNLLKLIKEHHSKPKQLIVENDLPQKLKNLIEERRDGQRSGGQVLVKEMATSLLQALHINTVL
ncbi:Uncharacterized protein Rs2_20325 [Raphanus sativus]|nr:Uncharacterized protein Rs2_20325 [Raphanus sativus]